jgi:hypothetical protein
MYHMCAHALFVLLTRSLHLLVYC